VAQFIRPAESPSKGFYFCHVVKGLALRRPDTVLLCVILKVVGPPEPRPAIGFVFSGGQSSRLCTICTNSLFVPKGFPEPVTAPADLSCCGQAQPTEMGSFFQAANRADCAQSAQILFLSQKVFPEPVTAPADLSWCGQGAAGGNGFVFSIWAKRAGCAQSAQILFLSQKVFPEPVTAPADLSCCGQGAAGGNGFVFSTWAKRAGCAQSAQIRHPLSKRCWADSG
jgi:hypothetical protein